MKIKFAFALLGLALLTTEVFAQATPARVYASCPAVRGTPYPAGLVGEIAIDINGNLCTSAAGGGGPSAVTQSGTWTMQPGNTANTTPWLMSIAAAAGTPVAVVTANGNDDVTNSVAGLYAYTRPSLWDGTNWDRMTSITGAPATGIGVMATAVAPTSAANNGIVPVRTTAAANNLVLKGSAGNLYHVHAVSSSAGLLMVFNATTAPADGPVQPVFCKIVPAGGEGVISFNPGPPARFATGIVAAFSSGTDCFAKVGVNAFIAGMVQ